VPPDIKLTYAMPTHRQSESFGGTRKSSGSRRRSSSRKRSASATGKNTGYATDASHKKHSDIDLVRETDL
jgi:hypothetical protein